VARFCGRRHGLLEAPVAAASDRRKFAAEVRRGAARSVARPGIAGPALTTSLPPVALLAHGAVEVEHDDRLVRQRPTTDRCRRRSGGHEKGDPGLLRKTGAYRPDGVRGLGSWGHAHPALGHSTRRVRCGSCLESFRACGAAPQERRIALSTLRSGYPSACGDTLGREKGRRGLALRPFAF
jgi:hypothetical protein